MAPCPRRRVGAARGDRVHEVVTLRPGQANPDWKTLLAELRSDVDRLPDLRIGDRGALARYVADIESIDSGSTGEKVGAGRPQSILQRVNVSIARDVVRPGVSVDKVRSVSSAACVVECTALDGVATITTRHIRVGVVTGVDGVVSALPAYRVVVLIATDGVIAALPAYRVVSGQASHNVRAVIPGDRVIPGRTEELMRDGRTLA